MIKRGFILAFWVSCRILTGQNISGIVINEASGLPVEFVNIGICKKNMGTVSDMQGKFNLFIDPQYDHDTLLFSCIGYDPLSVKIADLRKNPGEHILLKEKVYGLDEVTVNPQIFKPRTLGVTTKFKKISAGFKDNLLGYECGILMKVKKRAFIKRVNINISYCSYDTIFYRLNIYKVHGKKNFENILREPIYIKMPKNLVKDEIHIDLQSKNIAVDGDFLLTLEHIKDLGPGYLYFCAGIMEKTYFRKTSQGEWDTAPIGISLSVEADVEK